MKKNILVVLFIISCSVIRAQGCGPLCPACSGSDNSGGTLLNPGEFGANFLFIPDGEEERAVGTFRAGVFKWLDVGVGYALEAEEVIWSLRLQLSEDGKGWKPSLIAGTGSVQMGGSDQSVYMQLSKTFTLNELFEAGVSAGAASLLPDLDELFTLAGLNLSFAGKWTAYVSYDGRSFHEGLSVAPVQWLSLGVLLLESEQFALTLKLNY